MTTRKSDGITSALAAVIAAAAVAASGATVTLAPPSGTSTNVLALYAGETSVEIAGPGTVSLNPANTYTGGTTLSGGTLAYSGTYHDGVSPLGSGTLSIASADAIVSGSGTIANDISATKIANFAPEGTIALSGNNVFSTHLYFSQNTLEVTGGETRSSGGLYLAYPEGKTTGTAHFRQSGGSVTLGGNVHLAAIQGTTSSFTMTGGSFDVGGKNVLVYGSTGNGTSHATIDISGDAVLSNIAYLYVHSNNPTDADLSANIHDGGRLGFKNARHSGSSARATVRLFVNGGTLANDNTGANKATLMDWISTKGVASVKVGPKGATFTTDNGAKAGTAQIARAITAEAAEAGETAKGLTFDRGCWEFTAAGNAYEGPTVIKNGAVLFLDAKGTIPSTSTVTVGSGSELCTGGGNKTVADLVLEKDAILGFGTSSSTPYTLTVTGSLALPAYAKIALYDSNAPVTTAVTAGDTYAVLKVPASCAAALAAVKWSCATASAGNTYTFSVATAGDTATLSMTIAAASAAGTDFTVAAGEKCALGATSVGSETITVNGTLLITGDLTGTGAGGKVIVGNGGVLDVTGSIRPNSINATFDLYLNEGGSIFTKNIAAGDSTYDTTNPIRLNGGTIYPVANDNNTLYTPRYSSVLISDGGVTYDLSHWRDGGRDEGWVRFSCNSPFGHDPSGAAIDGGITVRGTPGEPVCLGFGSGFAGSTMNGGITAEEGGYITVSHAEPLTNQTVTLLPGSLFKPYNSSTCAKVNSLTFGRAGATAPVLFQPAAETVPALAVESLSILSPVEVSFCIAWNKDAAVNAGVSTAMVFKAVSPIDTSLFQLPASATSYSLSAETVALTEGDYAGYTALVLTVTGEDIGPGNLELKTDGTNVTLSADATYDRIYVGDIEGSGPKSLTVTGGEIAAQYLYIANLPVDGDSVADKHTCTYTQSGGKVSVTRLYSAVNSENPSTGRANSAITLNGGTLEVTDQVRLGHNRQRRGCTSTLTINDGAAMTVGDKMWLTYYNNDSDGKGSAQGIVNMNGGTLSVAGNIDLSRCEFHPDYAVDGGLFLKGGVLSAPNIVQTAANNLYQRLVFDGGVYAPNAAATNRTLTGLAVANIAAGGAIVDTSAFAPGGAYTIAQNLLTDPALNGAADGGFTKRGTGTLVLSGANTFTGPTRVEGGILAITSGEAVSGDIDVSDSAVLDLGGASVSVGKIAASGLVRNGSLIVTGAIAAADAESMLAVDGDLTLAPRSAIDFGGCAAVPTGWTPVAVASGTVTVPGTLRARNAGEFNRCETQLIDGVLYVKLSTSGTVISFR